MDRFELWKNGELRGANAFPRNTLEDLRALRSWGANVVCFGVDSLMHFQPSFPYQPERMNDIQRALHHAREAGLFATINFRSAPGREDFKLDMRLFQDYEYHDLFVRMWRATADYLKGHDHIAGYDLMCEPHPEGLFRSIDEPLDPALDYEDIAAKMRGTPADWSALARRTTQAIREVDPDTPIIVNSTGWAYPQTFAYLEPTGDPRTVYSVHYFSPRFYALQKPDPEHRVEYPGVAPRHVEIKQYWDAGVIERTLSTVSTFQQEHNVPIFAGELGCVRWAPGALQYLHDVLELVEKSGWSWAYWDLRSWDAMDIEKTAEPEDKERHKDTALLSFYRSRFARNKVYLKPEPV